MPINKTLRGLLAAALPMFMLGACSMVPNKPEPLIVTGTATYRERMALPPQAVFEASVEDVSLADAPSVRLGHVRIDAPKVPVSFAIPVDPARIKPRHRYIVSASIKLDGRLLFVTDTAHHVLDERGVRHADIVLKRVVEAPPR